MSFAHNFWRSVRSAYLRITFSRLSLTFFAFSTIYCIVQGVIQSLLINTDLRADDLVSAILHEAEVPIVNVPWHTQHGNHTTLKICSQIPGSTSYNSCIIVYDNANATEVNANWTAPVGFRRADVTNTEPQTLLTIPKGHSNAGTSLQAMKDATGSITGVLMLTEDGDAFLNEQCTRVLLYPHQILRNSKHEEIILLVGQFWFFGISVCALIFDSIPHILALVCMRILETGWSSYTIWRTRDIHRRFHQLLIDASSPCHTDLLLPHYFRTRLSFQIPDLVLNVTGLLCTAFLGWHLIKVYNVHSFKRVGPPKTVVRIYRFFLTLSISLNVSLFLMIASMALWTDQLKNGAIAVISRHTAIYNFLFIFTVVTLAPWCYLGLYAVRHERKILMSVFLAFCFLYIACWSIMFYSHVYRWTWVQWPFFASLTVASFIVLIAAGLFATICLLNFNKGLGHYLHVEGVLAQSDFQPEMFSNDIENNTDNTTNRPVHLRRKSSFVCMDGGKPSIQIPAPSLSIKKDTNWDFGDTKRPAIYMIELGTDRTFRKMPQTLV